MTVTTNPYQTGTTPESRAQVRMASAHQQISWLRRDTAVPSGSVSVADATTTVKGKLKLAGHLDGTADAPTIRTTSRPQVQTLGVGTPASTGTTTLTVQSTAMGDRILADSAHGDPLYHYGESYDGARYEVRQGTVAAPVTARGPMVKYSRYVDLNTDGTLNGTEASPWALLSSVIEASTTTKAQPVAIFGHAVTSATTAASFPNVNPDATAIIGIARVKSGGAGAAVGAFFRGALNSSVAGAHCTGVESQVVNQSGGDHLWTDTLAGANGVGSRSMGLWVPSVGDHRCAVAIQIGRNNTAGWDVGLGFTGPGGQGNAVVSASIRDDGNAARSLYILGTHATAAIEVGFGAGNTLLGGSGWDARLAVRPTTASKTAIQIQGTTSQTAPVLQVATESSGVSRLKIFDHGQTTIADASAVDQLSLSSADGGSITWPATGVKIERDLSAAGWVKFSSGSLHLNGKLYLSSSGTITINQTNGNGYIEMLEQTTEPSAPSFNDRLRLYAKDLGAFTGLHLRDSSGHIVRLVGVLANGSPIWGQLPRGLTNVADVFDLYSGSSPALVANTLYLVHVYIGNPCDLTGIKFAMGSAAPTTAGNVFATLYDAQGNQIAITASTSCVGATVNDYMTLPFIGTENIRAVGSYYIGLQFDTNFVTNGGRVRTHASSLRMATDAQAQGSFTAPSTITPPITYTANVGPVAHTY